MCDTLWPDEEVVSLALREDGVIACSTRSRPFEILFHDRGRESSVKVGVEWTQVMRWTSLGHVVGGSVRSAFVEDSSDVVSLEVPDCVGLVRNFALDHSCKNDLVAVIGGGACVYEQNTLIWSLEGHFVDAALSASKKTIFLAEENSVSRYGFKDRLDVVTTHQDLLGRPEAVELNFPDLFVAFSATGQEPSRIVWFSWSLECIRSYSLQYVTSTWRTPSNAAQIDDYVLQLRTHKDYLLVVSSRATRAVRSHTESSCYPLHIWNEGISECDMLPSGHCIYTGHSRKGVYRACIYPDDSKHAEEEELNLDSGSTLADEGDGGNIKSCEERERGNDPFASWVAKEECITILTGPIPEHTALGRAMRSETVAQKLAPKTQARKGTNVVQDLPTTFHRRIKSSGYLPRPKTKTKAKAKGLSLMIPTRTPAYSSEPPLHQEASMSMPSAITDVHYTRSASHLLCATSADYTLWSFRCPATKSTPMPLVHKGRITSICSSITDSHCTGAGGGPLCLTTADSTCHLWSLQGQYAGQELLRFDRTLSSRQKEGDAGDPIQAVGATFMCLDSVILIAMPTQLGIYRYQLHSQNKSDDVKRLQKFGAYKCTGLLQHDGSAMYGVCANNNSYSALAITHSQREIMVWDLAAEKRLAVRENYGKLTSVKLSSPPGAGSPRRCDLFYTASNDGCVRIWDLRTMKVECEFAGHQHSAHRLTPRWSPCMTYMAVPSEDGSVYMFDSRTTTCLGSTRSHKDVVSSVDFNPLSGTLVSGGFDNIVQFYRGKPAETKLQPKGGGREKFIPLDCTRIKSQELKEETYS